MWFDSTTGDHYKYPVSYYLEKLKNKVQRHQNFILPTIVEENFLNFQEVEEIKNKVIDYLYSKLDLSKHRYILLTQIQKLKFLADNEHYVSPNFKGFN